MCSIEGDDGLMPPSSHGRLSTFRCPTHGWKSNQPSIFVAMKERTASIRVATLICLQVQSQ